MFVAAIWRKLAAVSGLGGQYWGCQQDESPTHPHNSRPRPASAAALLKQELAATSAAGALDADSNGSDATAE